MFKRILCYFFVAVACFAFCVDAEAKKPNPAPKNPTPLKYSKSGKSARTMAADCYGKIERVICGEDFRVFVTKDWLRADARVHVVSTMSNGRRKGEWCFVHTRGDWRVRFVDDERDADFTVHLN